MRASRIPAAALAGLLAVSVAVPVEGGSFDFDGTAQSSLGLPLPQVPELEQDQRVEEYQAPEPERRVQGSPLEYRYLPPHWTDGSTYFNLTRDGTGFKFSRATPSGIDIRWPGGSFRVNGDAVEGTIRQDFRATEIGRFSTERLTGRVLEDGLKLVLTYKHWDYNPFTKAWTSRTRTLHLRPAPSK